MQISTNMTQKVTTQNTQKLNYNPKLVYGSLSQISSSIVARGKAYEQEFYLQFKSVGTISVDELKEQLKSEFAYAKFVSSDTQNPPLAGAQIYIDSENLNKMARDESYRAQIFGLIKRESEPLGADGYRFLQGGKMAHAKTVGLHISISKNNDGIVPYRGFSRGDVSFVESGSGFLVKFHKMIQKVISKKSMKNS